MSPVDPAGPASPAATAVAFGVGGVVVEVVPRRVVVAGYTGRDEAAVRAHVEELAAQGIAPPPRVPMLYELDAGLVTTAASVSVAGASTSGEVEPLLVRRGRRWFLGVASDHTDRALERVDVGRSKAACPKPVGAELVALPDSVGEGGFDAVWDGITVGSRVDGVVYQRATLASLRCPSDLLGVLAGGLDEDPDEDLVVLGGTVPLLTEGFRFGSRWELELTVAGRTLTHSYDVEVDDRQG